MKSHIQTAKYILAKILQTVLDQKWEVDCMPRKDRSDITVGSLEKKHGLPKGAIRNPDGRKARKDKQLKTIKKQLGK